MDGCQSFLRIYTYIRSSFILSQQKERREKVFIIVNKLAIHHNQALLLIFFVGVFAFSTRIPPGLSTYVKLVCISFLCHQNFPFSNQNSSRIVPRAILYVCVYQPGFSPFSPRFLQDYYITLFSHQSSISPFLTRFSLAPGFTFLFSAGSAVPPLQDTC